MKTLKLTYILLFLSFFTVVNLQAQEKRKIQIEYSGFLTFDEVKYPGAKILTRDESQQVHIIHETTNMWCDKAYFYGQENFVEAFGNVNMIDSDTIHMQSKYVKYDGITKLAFASGDVELKDPNSTITSDTLYFDRERQQAFYRNGGIVVVDSSGTITSKIGRYYMPIKKFQFVKDVVLVNPDATINSNYFDFYQDKNHAYLFGPSTITTEESKTYCEKGFYDTKTKIGYAMKNAKIDYDNRIIEGDSLYFDNNISFSSATNNIKVTDTINNSVIKGHYAELYKDLDSLFITKRALAITVQEKDSIYIHADTLLVTGIPEKRITRAYRNMRLYKSDMSAKADSVHANQATGLTQLINIARLGTGDQFSTKRKPILWNEENQMTGDTIHLISNTEAEKLDSLIVFNNAFLISKDSLGTGYNQISGQRLIGLFNDENKLKQVNIIKNAESIYYARNEDGELTAIDKARSGYIEIYFEDSEIVQFKRLNQVDGKAHPQSKFPDRDKILKGYDWREDERPKSIEDLFKDDPPLELPVIKGLDDYVPQDDFFESLNERINASKRIYEVTTKKADAIPFTKLTLRGGSSFSLTEINKTLFNMVKVVGTPTTVVMGVYVEFTYDDLTDLDKTLVLDLQKAPTSESLNQIKILKGITDWNPINYPINLPYKDGKSLINIYEMIMASSKKSIDYYSGVNSLQLFIGYFDGFDTSKSTNTLLDYNMTMYLKTMK